MEKKNTARFADMLAALGSEQRLEIVRLLLRAGEAGLTVGQVQEKVQIPNSTLNHHLDKLRQEGLVGVQREAQFLRHTVNLETLGRLIAFLCARCYQPEQLGGLFQNIRQECGGGKKRKASVP